MVGVSWHDALTYCEWLARGTGQPYRLPSEAKREYAACAGSTRRYSVGDQIGDKDANFRGKIGTTEVGRIERRITERHGVPFSYDAEAVKLIASRCTELESGGRMIDAILTNTVLPALSGEFLTRMLEGRPIARVHLSVEGSEFRYAFE